MKIGPLLMLPVLFLSQKIDFQDANTVMLVQIIYAVVQVVVLMVYGYVYFQIKNKNDQTTINVPSTGPFRSSNPTTTISTVKDYDEKALGKLVLQLGFGIAIAIFLSTKWHIMPPLVLQCLLTPMNMFNSPLFKLFVLKEPPSLHPRPFAEENQLTSFFSQAPNQTITTPATNTTSEDTDDPTIQEPSKKSRKSKKVD